MKVKQHQTADASHLEIVPMGRVDSMSVSIVAANLQGILGLNVLTQDARPEPDYAFSPHRGQYDSGKIIRQIASSNSGFFLLGIVNLDIYTPILTFVFGESQLGGKAALVSLHRIADGDIQQTYIRAAKIAVHEVGHLLGIAHCPTPDCLMVFSNNLEKLDSLPLRFCRACEYESKRRLRHLFEK